MPNDQSGKRDQKVSKFLLETVNKQKELATPISGQVRVATLFFRRSLSTEDTLSNDFKKSQCK